MLVQRKRVNEANEAKAGRLASTKQLRTYATHTQGSAATDTIERGEGFDVHFSCLSPLLSNNNCSLSLSSHTQTQTAHSTQWRKRIICTSFHAPGISLMLARTTFPGKTSSSPKTRLRFVPFVCVSMFVCVCLSVCLGLSLSHTHTLFPSLTLPLSLPPPSLFTLSHSPSAEAVFEWNPRCGD